MDTIKEIRNPFFEKISKIDTPLARLRKKRKKTQITNIREERGTTTAVSEECYKQAYDNG